MDDAEALLPSYLRFVKGVIDSSDLPLNVSRELLQESRDVKAIREGSTKRVLSMLEDLAKKQKTAPESAEGKIDVGSGRIGARARSDRDGGRRHRRGRQEQPCPAAEAAAEYADESGKYARFYAEFGAVLKEGLGEDFGNRDRIAKLLRFASTTSDAASVSFADYKARMKEGQDAIYYITADTLAAAKNSPQLEVFKKKGIEVLLMTDRVDEWALNYLTEFDGTPLQSVAKGAVDLGKLQDEAEKKAAEEAAESFKPLLEKLKEALKDKAEDVRVTTRLVDSPACLVVQDGGMSTQLARMLKQAGQPAPDLKPVLEVERRARAGEEARRLGAFRRPCEHPVRPGAAGRRRPAGRPRGLREARERAAGVNARPRTVRRAAAAAVAVSLLLPGGRLFALSHRHSAGARALARAWRHQGRQFLRRAQHRLGPARRGRGGQQRRRGGRHRGRGRGRRHRADRHRRRRGQERGVARPQCGESRVRAGGRRRASHYGGDRGHGPGIRYDWHYRRGSRGNHAVAAPAAPAAPVTVTKGGVTKPVTASRTAGGAAAFRGARVLPHAGRCRGPSGRQPRHAGQSRRALMAALFQSSAPRTGARVPR